jgi:predicted transcriptional regulator
LDKNYEKYNDTAELLKTLAHPVRLCIVNGLMGKGECNVSFMQSCLGVPQSTISQHLQKLRMAGIINGKRNGLEINYQVCNDRVEALMKVLFQEDK